jgi:uncharacterized membrane protein YheB (UPF0754 family)
LVILLGYATAGSDYQPILTNIGFFALSGSLTNGLAIYMLFEKVPFLYGSGVVALQFESFKDGIKNLVMQEFFTHEHISAVMTHLTIDQKKWESIANSLNYDKIYEALVEGILESSFGKMITLMGGQEAIEPLRASITTKLRIAVNEMLKEDNLQKRLVEEFIGNYSGFSLTIEKIVDNRLAILTPNMVKDIIQKMIHQHLGWLVVWGGVFGGLIGLITSFV